MSPRPKSRTRRRSRNTPRSPQTILAHARRNNLERALERGDVMAALTGIGSEGGNGGAKGSRAGKVSKGRRRPRKYSKFVALPAFQDPLEENCLERQPPPAGYVFVPKGDVYITRHCRSQTKEAQQIVYVVYTNNGKRILGLRVPAAIHASVRESATETADSRANAVHLRDAKDLSRSRQLLCSRFPLMPDESLEVVLDHAFLKGSGRVGRTSTKTDERKAVLAVEAHIRHVHTSYEELLESGMDRKEARDAVGGTVRAVRLAWEGGENRPSGLLAVRSR